MNGGAEGDRTLDLCIANAALSQLSYRPVFRRIRASGQPAVPAAGRHCKAPPELAKAHLIKRIGMDWLREFPVRKRALAGCS